MGIPRSASTIRVILDEAKEAPMRRKRPNISVPRTPPKIARGAARAAEDISSDICATASSWSFNQ